jgi:hypothetical protein
MRNYFFKMVLLCHLAEKMEGVHAGVRLNSGKLEEKAESLSTGQKG